MKGRIAIAVFGFVFSSVFFIDLCGFVYRCGCVSLWAGSDQHCNIHHTEGKHCPVCAQSGSSYAIVFSSIAVPQLLTALFLRRGHWAARLGLVLAMLPAVGGAVMAVFGWLAGYWT